MTLHIRRPLSARFSAKKATKKRRSPQKPKQFSSVEHLSLEAIAAFVDGELSESAAHRARVHVVQCPECREDVYHQRGASGLVRGSNLSERVRAPQDLMARLKGIAHGGCEPGPDASETPCAEPEDFMDKVETLVRTLRRIQGYGPQNGTLFPKK